MNVIPPSPWSLQDPTTRRWVLVASLVNAGILRTPAIVRAMLTVPREEFLPVALRDYAYADASLPIGWGQTTSAPHMVAILSEHAELRPGKRVLEIGSGLGYMACVYAEAVAPHHIDPREWGHVWSAEIVWPLASIAEANIKRLGFADRVEVLSRDASEGLRESAPFDVIIVPAAGPQVPESLIDQLAAKGALVMPVGNAQGQALIRVRRLDNGSLVRETLGLTRFVPLTGSSGWSA